MRDARSAQSCPPSLAFYVFAAVLLVRLLVLVRFSASAFFVPAQGDMHFYNDWALRILHGQWTDGKAFYGLPLYPYLLAALYKVCGYCPFVPALLQACADSGTAAILYRLAAFLLNTDESKRPLRFGRLNLTAGDVVGLVAAAAWCFYTPSQAYSSILMPTAFAVFVFWFVVWQIVRREVAPQPWLVLTFGFLIGFTAMGIATTLFLIPLFIAALVFKWNTRGLHGLVRPASLAILLIAGVAFGTLPCWAHNYFIAHEPVLLSAHSGVNFWIGNNPVANGYPKMPPGLHAGQEAMLQDSVRVAERDAGHELRRADVSRYWSEKANTFIRTNPRAELHLVAAKIANFWNSFQYDDLSMITNLRLQGVLLPGLRFGIIAALGLAAFPLVAMRFRGSRWVIAAVILHMASLLSVFVTERYRLAAVPGLTLLASLGAYLLWHNLSTARWRPALVQLCFLAAATTFVSIPRGDPSLWALDPYNSGWLALESHNLPLAKEKLELAYSYVPTNAEVNFALGNLQLEKHDMAEAKRYFAATLRLDPEHEGAWNNLGVLALDERRWELATKFFAGALRTSPDDPKTHFLLARANLELGRYPKAEAELAFALRARPQQPEFVALRERITAAMSAHSDADLPGTPQA
jgi:tetratricopeptide (TPR) repeat protein